MKQISYVRVSNETHPISVGNKITHSNFNLPDLNDYKIIEEIIDSNKALGLEDVGGEWKYLNEIKRKTYIDALINNDPKKLVDLFINFFQTSCGYEIMTPSFSEINQYDLESQILWDLDGLTTDKYYLSTKKVEGDRDPERCLNILRVICKRMDTRCMKNLVNKKVLCSYTAWRMHGVSLRKHYPTINKGGSMYYLRYKNYMP